MTRSLARALCSISVSILVVFTLSPIAAPVAFAAPQTTSTSGVVVDAQGTPVARARVRLVASSGREEASSTSDATGRFTLPLPVAGCADCQLEAALAGFITNRVALSTGPARITLDVAPVRESVVVTATRGDAAGIVSSSVTVVDRDTIEGRGTPIVSELLKATPSVTVVRTGGMGNVTSLFVRGGESDYNKVLLDGIPLNEPGGTFNFSNLTTGSIERIEVVRGAMSALFGSDAMSSVIQLFSTRGRAGEKPRVNASFEGGSYDTRRLEGGISGGAGGWDYSVSVGRFDTDNRVANNAFDNTTVAVAAGGNLNAAGTLTLRTVLRLEQQHVGVPGQTAFGRADSDAFFDRDDTVAGVSVQHRVSNRWQQKLGFSVSNSIQVSTNLFDDPPYTPTFEGRSAPFQFFDFTMDTRNELRRYSTSYQSDWYLGSGRGAAGAQVITAAVDIDTQRATLGDTLAATELTAARDNFGVTLQHQITGGRLSTSASARVEHNSSFGNAFVPRGSAAYLLRANAGTVGDTTVRASAGLGIKEPTILETFSQNFYFLGNPDLLPERSKSFDAGIEQRLFRQRAKVELTWFDGRYRNQISTRTIDPMTFQGQYFNIGRTRARGTELVVEAQPVDGLRITAGHTFLASKIVESTSPTSAVFRVGAWTFRRPRHSGFLNVALTHGRVALDLSGVFSGRRVDSDFASLQPPIEESNLPAVWTLGLRGRVTKGLEAFLRVENLSNADYMDPLGYQTWQRTAHAGLRLGF